MAQELSYVLITPYTIVKSRTGGVISRLLSRVDLELCAAQIFAPSLAFAERYAESIRNRPVHSDVESLTTRLISDYVLSSFSPSEGRRHRVMLLLFRGEDACEKLNEIVGTFHPELRAVDMLTGETVRDTYADLVMSKEDPEKVSYFEPAVLVPPHQQEAVRNLRILAEFIESEPNIVESTKYTNPHHIERTLVIIKPDNWRYPSSRPGTIIDMFSRTGLRIIACKIAQMSVAQALEFYKPVEEALKTKLAAAAGMQAKEMLEERFKFSLSDESAKGFMKMFGEEYAHDQFNRIVEFMSGIRPDACPEDQWDHPGTVKSMVLVYEGENAVQRIRTVLGPTDPTQAPSGTVRREFGSNVMVNTAHASDAVESAEREMGIVGIRENPLCSIISDFLNEQEKATPKESERA